MEPGGRRLGSLLRAPPNRLLKNLPLRRLLKKAQVQGGARCEVRGVLGPYVAPPRERANAPPAAPEAAGRDVGPFSAAC